MVTWPSAAITTLLSLRTHSTVVPCICSLLCVIGIRRLYLGGMALTRRLDDDNSDTVTDER